jgi:hypothetical protein
MYGALLESQSSALGIALQHSRACRVVAMQPYSWQNPGAVLFLFCRLYSHFTQKQRCSNI